MRKNQGFLLRRDRKSASADNFWTLIVMALIFIVNHHPHGTLKFNPKQISKKPTHQSIPGLDSFRYAVTEQGKADLFQDWHRAFRETSLRLLQNIQLLWKKPKRGYPDPLLKVYFGIGSCILAEMLRVTFLHPTLNLIIGAIFPSLSYYFLKILCPGKNFNPGLIW